MAVRRTTAATRPSPSLQALLGLSGLLARGKAGGLLSEALALVLEGVGASRGAAYEASDDGLELKADVGLPATLRAYIRTFPSSEVPWFPAQTAAKKRRVVTETEAQKALAGRIDPDLVGSAGWATIAAAPILIGRDVLGVLVVAASAPEMLSPEAPFVLETAANMLALSMAHEKAREHAAALVEATKVAGDSHEGRGADAKLARLAILGSLAAGFADEMRWPLSSLGTQLEEQEKLIGHLRVRFPGVASALDDLARIQDEATTALRFARTAGTRLLSALEDSSAEPVDLEDLAHEAAALVEPTARGKNVDLLVTVMHGTAPVVVGKRSDLGQLLLALITNGVEACAAAAAAASTKAGEGEQKPLVCVAITREMDRVVVRVEDAGPGIPPDVRARIFDPFFTTKKDALGIGLTLARQVAASHGGALELDRSELGGALVRVVLPAAPADVVVLRDQPPPPSRRKPLFDASEAVIAPSSPIHSPSTARDGWTSAPKPIEQRKSRRPVRAPVPIPNALVVTADTDVCAPTQRVPRTPSGGHAAQTPKVPDVAPACVSRTTAPRVTIVSSPGRAQDSSQMATQKLPPKVARTNLTPGGSLVPTDRVPEAPRRAPRSRRSKESPQ
ncbi:GAF domain-containing sensor histidine kinase [Polyangium spumosum]|uniref:histidine kinase n=1 Tax=Polyangium spumosum TaxID=889282 RepID=A0A6N7PXW0_9BACT|nr:GAF domain-containing sensor histidine kinase [Polyangium spumosum]MRG93601.1 GAF domain-containing protein [Polyangium spumosum]